MNDKNNAFWDDRLIEAEFRTNAYTIRTIRIDDEDDGSWWIDEK